jgi:hypothetical protein
MPPRLDDDRDVWIDELQLLIGDAVRLEHVDESLAAGVESDGRSAIVAALSWRDPSFFQSLAEV